MIRFETLRFIGEESRSGSRRSGLSATVTIRFETLRFIGESCDQVPDAQVYRGESTIRFRDAPVYRGESRSGLRRSGLSGRVAIKFQMLRFIGNSHNQVRGAQVIAGRDTIRFETLRFIGDSHDQV